MGDPAAWSSGEEQGGGGALGPDSQILRVGCSQGRAVTLGEVPARDAGQGHFQLGAMP